MSFSCYNGSPHSIYHSEQMAADTKKYKSKGLDFEKILPYLNTVGTGVTHTAKTEKEHHFKGVLATGGSFFIKVFKNTDGSITIGKATGFDANFEVVADSLLAACSFSKTSHTIEYSIPGFPQNSFNDLRDFLTQECSASEELTSNPKYTQIRAKGKNNDTITLKYYSNQTIQIQGKFTYLAHAIDDFLRNVLSYDKFLTHQLEKYKLDIPLNEIKTELTAIIPCAHEHIHKNVRSLFSSALALSKIDVTLEEYSFIVFPALRGLEGAILEILRKFFACSPTNDINLGEYFERNGSIYSVRSIYKNGNSSDLCQVVAQCYTLWHDQRHGLFHMDGTVETTRMLCNISDARTITTTVFQKIDSCYKTLSDRGCYEVFHHSR